MIMLPPRNDLARPMEATVMSSRWPGLATGFADTPGLTFNLHRSDFTTAQNVAGAINKALGLGTAQASDAVSVAVRAPVGAEARAALMAAIENLDVVSAEPPAKVIVNARTGTVVINSAVRVGPAAVTHGKLTVRIDESQRISQPEGFSDGVTAIEQRSNVQVEEERKPMFLLAPGPRLADVVKAVNAIGASPADLVAILEALKAAGSLKAELIVL